MNFFETSCIGLILILFPLYVYLFYVIYNVDIGRKDNNLLLDFALCTSFYLSLRFGTLLANGEVIFLCNTVLLLCYLTKREGAALFISILSIVYYSVYAQFSLPILLLEYIAYFLIYLLYRTGRVSNRLYSILFIAIQILCIFYFLYLAQGSFTFDETLIKSIADGSVFLLTCICAKFLFESGESMIRYHHNVKLMKEEKNFRDSLFKITHEIKNPIAVCKGYLDMFDVKNPKHSEKYIPVMKQEIARTLLLLEDFLSMNKIKIEKDILDINLLLEEVCSHFELLLKEKNIDSAFIIDEEELYIMGDYNRIVQVFINMVKNGIEAIGEKEDGFIRLYTKVTEDEVKIIVEDNGCGISMKDMKRIKEPFYSTKRRGTGLGVSLSSEIIEAHDGTMEYASEEGNGTRVTITLPILKEGL